MPAPLAHTPATARTAHGVVMPPLRTMFRGIAAQVAEGTVVPALIFWAVLHTGRAGLGAAVRPGLVLPGDRPALGARRRLPAVLVVGALLFTTRTGMALAFHSTFVYLLTPTINAFALAAGLRRVSAAAPAADRAVRPRLRGAAAHVTALDRVQTALRRLSLVWAMVNVVSGGVALQLLVAEHYDAVLVTRSVLTPVLSAAAVACCIVMGRRALRAEGIHLHVRWQDAPAVG